MTVPIIRKYNPGFLSDDDLIASFRVRMNEFASIMEILRECTGSSNAHQIVIGPRGSGKTSLLLRVAAEVRRDAELLSTFFPIVFAEESYGIATAGEFWLECLSRLADDAPRRQGSPDLRRTFEDLRTIRDDRTLGDRCLGTLLDFADREGKRLVLMVENLGMMFRDMTDPHAGWRLRKILQTEPRIILLASATSHFDEIDNPSHALYDLFRTLTLRPLDTNECAVLWESVSGRHVPDETIRSLEILTGGSPRLLAIVARFGIGQSFRSLMDELLNLIDDHTEYFRNHLESLPAQERRVYLALADLWKPALTKEIADRARIETSKCSAQLIRLVERGVVQVAGGSARRKQYYLNERLYNIYYLLRRRRGPDPLIKALIRFMSAYYSPHDLRGIGARIATEVQKSDMKMRSLLEAAFEQLMALPALAENRENLLAKTLRFGANTKKSRKSTTARTLFEKAIMLIKKSQMKEALTVFDEVVQRFGKSEKEAICEIVAFSLFFKGAVQCNVLDQLEDALITSDQIVDRFGNHDSSVLIDVVLCTLVNRMIVLKRLMRLDDALVTYNEVVHRFEKNPSSDFHELIAQSLIAKGDVLVDMKRFEEAILVYDEVVRRFENDQSLALSEKVTTALVNKEFALAISYKFEEALVICDQVVRRFGKNQSPAIVEGVLTTFVNKGTILNVLNRPEETLDICDEVTHRFEANQTPAHKEMAKTAFFIKGAALRMLDRPDEILITLDEATRRFGKLESPEFDELSEYAFIRKAEINLEHGRYEEAVVMAARAANQNVTRLPMLWRSHLIQAKAGLAEGDLAVCEQEVEVLLTILPKLDPLEKMNLDTLVELSIGIGIKRMWELIQASPAVDLLLPLTTALERELGLETRVAREVEEVAEDIRRKLGELRETKADKIGK